MRPRFVVLASILAALVAVSVPAIASAAPQHNRGLTINATPDPIIAGDGVLIYGQLKGSDIVNKPVVLYHRLATQPRFTIIGVTRTDSHGFYQFTRAEGVVLTNRSWYVRGSKGVHSRTVHEHVSALVDLVAGATSLSTRQPITFSGHITPDHPGEIVRLQAQKGGSDNWHTIKAGRTNGASDYSISYRWRVPGVRDVRVVFPGDARNDRGVSDPATVTVEQAQIPSFEINTSAPIISYGQTAAISGMLDKAGTTSPLADTPVTLCSRTATQTTYTCNAATTTNASGGYAFAVNPTVNAVYVIRTTLPPHRHTAALFEGVRDLLTIMPSSTSSAVGQKITLSGVVTPDKAGDVVYLQRLGKDGNWHNVEVRSVRHDSSYRFGWRFGNSGSVTFRARIPGDPDNVGAASPRVTVAVAPAPVASLPPAS
jgi:hypothetical protein